MKVEKRLYAIYDTTNEEVIWNCRGGAYRDTRNLLNKMKKLKKENPDNEYRVLQWEYAGSARVKLEE